jgi:hypothetical protein
LRFVGVSSKRTPDAQDFHNYSSPTLRNTFFSSREINKAEQKFLYDAEIVAGSPHEFEKHPQELFLREQPR